MKKRTILIIAFIIYLTALLRITVFRSGFDFSNAFSGGDINPVPFANLINVFIEDKRTFIYLFFGNIIWFVPFGFLLRRITGIPAANTVLFGCLLSLFIETMQLIFGIGVFEIDDLLLNTFGVLLGTVK